jgi:hypothetical protein
MLSPSLLKDAKYLPLASPSMRKQQIAKEYLSLVSEASIIS